MSLPRDRNKRERIRCSKVWAIYCAAMTKHLKASNKVWDAKTKVRDALNNYEEFTVRVVQRMDKRIASLSRRIRELKDLLYDYGGPSKYYEELEDLKEEMHDCRIQQRKNISHARILDQKLYDLECELREKELYLDGLEMPCLPKEDVLPLPNDGLELHSLQEEAECVTHVFDDVQSKVCDNSNLELTLDHDSTTIQNVEIEKVNHEIVCSEDWIANSNDCVEQNSEIQVENLEILEDNLVSGDLVCSKDVLEQVQFADCRSPLMLDHVHKEENHVVETLPLVPFVPSTLHIHDEELIGDSVTEIEPEPPPIIGSMLLDFDDPMLQLSCPFIYCDLRTNPLKGGGDDTTIMGTLGAGCENEDHHKTSKRRCDAYGAFGVHGVAWTFIEAHLCLWDSMEVKWMKNKHVKKKKGYVQCLWPYGLVISLIIVH